MCMFSLYTKELYIHIGWTHRAGEMEDWFVRSFLDLNSEEKEDMIFELRWCRRYDTNLTVTQKICQLEVP